MAVFDLESFVPNQAAVAALEAKAAAARAKPIAPAPVYVPPTPVAAPPNINLVAENDERAYQPTGNINPGGWGGVYY